jgi:hypothetical protein
MKQPPDNVIQLGAPSRPTPAERYLEDLDGFRCQLFDLLNDYMDRHLSIADFATALVDGATHVSIMASVEHQDHIDRAVRLIMAQTRVALETAIAELA